MLGQTGPEVTERLHITVRPVYVPPTMIEVNVRHNKYAVLGQDPRYFSELLRLESPHIFKNTLGYDDVEPLVVEGNGNFKEIRFEQVLPRTLYGDVNAVIFDIRRQEGHQGSWSAAHIQERTWFTPGAFIY